MNEIVSIIIPIYNSESLLEQTLESIKNQSYQNLEIIMVNDGSTDSSEKICEKYLKDKRFKYIYKDNSGVSDTRNLGINNATGNYIMFIDADDSIEEKYIENMVSVASKKKCDQVISGYTELKNNILTKKSVFLQKNKEKCFDISFPNEFEKFFTTNEFNPCWKQLLSKKMINDNNIRFNNKIKYGEDMLFSLECYKNSKKSYYLFDYGYNYLINDNGAMRKKDIKSLNKMYDDNLEITNIIVSKYNIDNENIQQLYLKTLKVFSNISSTIIKNIDGYTYIKNCINNARKKYDIIFKKCRIIKKSNFRQFISLFLLKHKLYFISYILKKYIIRN